MGKGGIALFFSLRLLLLLSSPSPSPLLQLAHRLSSLLSLELLGGRFCGEEEGGGGGGDVCRRRRKVLIAIRNIFFLSFRKQ